MGLVTRVELASILGVSTRTLSRDIARGLPVAKRRGRSLFFDVAVAKRWRAERGLDGSGNRPGPAAASRLLEELGDPPPGEAPSEEPELTGQAKAVAAAAAKRAAANADAAGTRGDLARARLEQSALRARRTELALQSELGLKGLGLGDMIREAKSLEALARVGLEVAARDAEGALTPVRSRSLKAQLTEARQLLQAHAAQPKEEADHVALYRAETLEVAEAFDKLVSDERRARVRAFVLAALEEDLRELPNVDPLGTL